MEGSAFFCVSDGLLSPCVESVLGHPTAGATQLKSGWTLLDAADAVKRAAGAAPDCFVSFLDRDRWARIRNAVAGSLVRPGEPYFFRIMPAEAFKACLGPPPVKMVLHRTIARGINGSQREVEFMRFMAKSTTQALCREMMDFLIKSASSSGEQERLCRECQDFFGFSLCFPNSFRPLQKTGVMLSGKQSFTVTISTREFAGQSGPLALSPEDETSLEELGFLFWMTQLQNIKPAVSEHQQITVVPSRGGGAGLHVEVLGGDLKISTTSNAVIKVRTLDDDNRELIMKVGHSLSARQLSEELCVQLRDQVENEAGILAKLQGSALAPRVVLAGFWEDRPVLLTELKGSPLPDEPMNAAMVEQMCRDLTGAVLHLFSDHGITHADISLSNIGVYFKPEPHTGRRFYLFDFGYAVDVRQQREYECPVSLLFSSRQAIASAGTSVGLVSELTAVAYVCLYLGCSLPWLAAAEKGDIKTCCDLREMYAMNLEDNKVLQCFGPRMQDWMEFVLSQPVQDDQDAGFAAVSQASQAFLGHA